MALQAREIKNRLRSIKNTRKITKAMELVSAAKMRKAVAATLETRSYAQALNAMMARLTAVMEYQDAGNDTRQFFETTRPTTPFTGHTTIIAISSNRGLAGAFNTNIVRKILALTQGVDRSTIDVIGIGKRGLAMLASVGFPAELAYQKDESTQADQSIQEVAQYVHQKFLDGKTDRVMLVYTDYQSALVQTVQARHLYPIQMTIEEGSAASTVSGLYEPSPAAVLSYLIPRLAEVQLYHALRESTASEHSARMVAMKSATDAAGDIASELLLQFNRFRQASITQEIAEISAGAAVLQH